MKLWSVVRLAVVACVLCSMSAFAAGILGETSSGDGQHHVSYYKGKGAMLYENARDERYNYEVTLKAVSLDMDGNRVTHHILAYKREGKPHFIATGSVGNAKGVMYVFGHKLEQVIERWPESNN